MAEAFRWIQPPEAANEDQVLLISILCLCKNILVWIYMYEYINISHFTYVSTECDE